MPKVSVLVAVYNAEQYLHECLDSLTAQTLHDIEIICIDDCSTDTSLDLDLPLDLKEERNILKKLWTTDG